MLYSFCPSRAVAVIFEKLPPAISVHFAPFRLKQTFFLKICLVRSTIANMCPSVINFDDLDFGERR